MKSWKQIALSLLILAAVAGGWYSLREPAGKTDGSSGTSADTRGGAKSAPLVVVEPAITETINSRLTAIGTVRALSTVSVTPYASGTMTKLYVAAGAEVKADEPIAELDSETEKIAVEKAQIALKDAENTLDRTSRLRQTNTASRVQEVAAELAVANAKLAVQDAQLALDRRTVRAPISGVVGILPVNVGNYITAQTSIARIDDRSKVLIDIWVPERFSPQISLDQPVTAESTALPGQLHQGRIVAVDNMIDETSRTLRVRAEFENPGDRLRAGMSFSVTLLFPGDIYPSVDPLAIQWGTDGSYVWKVEDGKAQKMPVRIVQRNTASVLVDAALKTGDQIVIEGVQSVRDNAPVRVKGSSGTASDMTVAPVAGKAG